MVRLDYFLATRPGTRQNASGDIALVKEFKNKVFIGIVDAEGHGEEAEKTASICFDFMERHYRQDLVQVMDRLHQRLKELPRKAVAGFALLELETGELTYVGVGNISARIFGATNLRIIPRPGLIGYAMSSLRQERIKLHAGDVLVLHTDGVEEHFTLEDYPGLLNEDAERIATRIIKEFGRPDDDALCVALRYRG
ncbi:MAG TPA: SpoIIE family protein phosphatase [Dehalococcoidia bacterium]|jgi:serine phosphatase RsbU (regulator of sigma subunit)|nr:SpoIIE family protein phosphatase [Dehalococcoidia bacterium]